MKMRSIFRDWRAAGPVCSFWLGALVFAFAGTVGPAAAAAPGLAISNPWIRFIVPGVPAAGYFTLSNTTATSAVLVTASSPDCGKLMLHRSVSQNGRDSMTGIQKVVVPAHQKLSFAPGDYHLMCTAPSALVKRGATIPVTLKFADGSTITAPFPVRDATGH